MNAGGYFKKTFSRSWVITLFFILFFLERGLSFAVPSPSYFEEWDVKDTFGRAEKAVGNRIGDYTLIDQNGNKFQLKELFDKPLLISFIYATCDYACPMITTHLSEVTREAGSEFGKRFRIITISFDSGDTPERMKNFGSSFIKDFASWKFATADSATVKNLGRDVGLSYLKTDKGFQHLNFFSIIDRSGKVYKQVYGIDFSPKAALKAIDMAAGQKRLWVSFVNIFDTIKAFCYTYDPKTGRYVPNMAMLVPVFLGTVAQTAIVFLLVYIFRGAHKAANKKL
ncbi:MAG: SCO family protein [Deltaproteobacteria bacterium]|nr:SCO family protein [Deltaproteobacteria bacterium]